MVDPTPPSTCFLPPKHKAKESKPLSCLPAAVPRRASVRAASWRRGAGIVGAFAPTAGGTTSARVKAPTARLWRHIATKAAAGTTASGGRVAMVVVGRPSLGARHAPLAATSTTVAVAVAVTVAVAAAAAAAILGASIGISARPATATATPVTSAAPHARRSVCAVGLAVWVATARRGGGVTITVAVRGTGTTPRVPRCLTPHAKAAAWCAAGTLATRPPARRTLAATAAATTVASASSGTTRVAILVVPEGEVGGETKHTQRSVGRNASKQTRGADLPIVAPRAPA